MHGDDTDESTASAQASGLFPATRWTRIRQAGLTDEALAAGALNEICRIYWYPTFVTARAKHRLDHHQAEDVTQSFWAWVVEKGIIKRATQERGKFRNYLLTCFQHHVAHEWRKDAAHKRGGRVPHVSIQSEDWNDRYERELGTFISPDEHLARVWDDAALESAFGEVEGNWIERGRGAIFTALKAHLADGAERGGLAQIAADHGFAEDNVRQMLTRLRRELREAGQQWLGQQQE